MGLLWIHTNVTELFTQPFKNAHNLSYITGMYAYSTAKSPFSTWLLQVGSQDLDQHHWPLLGLVRNADSQGPPPNY